MELIYNKHKYELVEFREPNSDFTFDIIGIFEMVINEELTSLGEQGEEPSYDFGHLVGYFYGSSEDITSTAIDYIIDYEKEYKYEGKKPQWKGSEYWKGKKTDLYSISYIRKDSKAPETEICLSKNLDNRLNTLEKQGCHDFNIEATKHADNTESHYSDDFIEVFTAANFCMWVMTNTHGESKAISYDDNFYTPRELLDAYRELTKEDNAPEESFRKWLLTDCGCEPELLED